MNINRDDYTDNLFGGEYATLEQARIRFDMMDEKDRVNPDKFSCEAMFILFFADEYMQADFPIIANDFYRHVPEIMKIENYTFYTFPSPEHSYMVKSFTEFTLEQILSSAKTGNEYSSKLLVYLYKTYYKKEYKILRRFKEISATEVLSITQSLDDYNFSFSIPARILTMCQFMGIKVDESCAFLYCYLDDIYEKYEKRRDSYSPQYTESKEYIEIEDEITKLFGVSDFLEVERECRKFRKYDRFRSEVYKKRGFNPSYGDMEVNVDLFDALIEAYQILKHKYPSREATKDELQVYASIYYDVSTVCTLANTVDEYYKRLLGEIDSFMLEESDFRPEEFEQSSGLSKSKAPAKLNNSADEVQNETIKSSDAASNTQYDQAVLLEQISDLRERLHKKEYDVQRLSELYTEMKHKVERSDDLKEIYDSEHEELIALREHVYNSTENDIELSKTSKQQYIDKIKDKRVVIVGGHSNWTQKMREAFPDWSYINFKSTTTIDDSILDSAEYVFFFTDMLKHHVYYRFINLAKQKRVPFGYIGSSNIEKCIKQIAEEMERH